MKRIFSHIGFSVAVTLLVLNLINVNCIIYITAGLTVLFAVSLAVKKYRQALALPLCFGSAVFACLLFLCVYNASVAPSLNLDGAVGDISFYINKLPEFKDGKYIYFAKAKTVLINGAPQNIKLRVVSETPITADFYQLVNANCSIYSIADKSFGSYGYWGDGIYLTAYVNEFTITDAYVFSPLKGILVLRNDIIETLVKSLGGDIGALSAALVTGDKYYLSDELITAFRLAGVSHLIAVSGLHLSVITGSVYFVMKRTGVHAKIRSAVIITLTLFYIALAGFAPSVVRAGIMLIAVFCAEFFKRKSDTLNSLGIAVFIICINPFAVSDAGAVLSVLSVLALVTVYPFINGLIAKAYILLSKRKNRALYPFKCAVSYILKTVVMSLSVILVTLPALYLFFSYISLASLFANILLIPLGSLSTVLSFLCWFSLKLRLLCPLFVLLSSGVNSLVIFLVKAFSSFSVFRFTFSGYFAFVIAGVLIILAINFILFNNKRLKTAFALSLIILTLSLAINAYSQYNSSEIIITEGGAAAVSYKGHITVFGVKTKSDYYCVKPFIQSKGNKIDLLIDNSSGEYSAKLNEEFSPKRCVNAVNYSADFGNGFTVDYFGEDNKVTCTVNNTTVTNYVNENSDIMISSKTVKDNNGTISLKDGGIIYRIYNKHIDVWRL